MSTRAKHLPHRPPARWQYVYDGRDLHAVVEHRPDGWHVILHKGGQALGVFATRELAFAAVNARIKNPPAAPLRGERERDAERVHKIHRHQQQAKASRARRSGTR